VVKQARARWVLIALAALVTQFLVFGVVQAWRDAPTYDEGFHLPMGVTALTRHQLRFTLEHPPLPYALAAIPALFAHPVIPSGSAWNRGDTAYEAEFMHAQDVAGKLRRLMFLARLVPLLEGAATGVLLFAIGRRLFSDVAGLVAAGAWLTLPTVAGLAHIDGIDIATAFTVTLSVWLLTRYLDDRTNGRAALVGAAAGVTLLTSFAGFASLGAIAVAMMIVPRARALAALRQVAITGVVAWLAVWAGYRIISPFPHFRRVDPAPRTVAAPAIVSVARLVPWPKEFITGFSDLERIAQSKTMNYILGHEWSGRAWFYWPLALAVKVPASTLLLVAFGCVYALVRQRTWRRALLAVGLPMVTLAATMMYGAEQNGVRYVLPVLALGLVLGGGAAATLVARRAGIAVIAVLAATQLFWFYESQPNSLAWTAPPFRPAYRVTTDSNVDWGQDLYVLRHWANGRSMYVAYFGGPGSSPGWPAARPVPSTVEAARGLRGTIAVSASSETAAGRAFLKWLWAYCPVEKIGDTILVYRFDGLVPATRIPTTPPSVCPGPYSRPSVG
jgi:4-amino-4-deoxy-L-arabinose transferase-like glycosyltransferase